MNRRQRWSGVFVAARALERIAARSDVPVQIPGEPGNAADLLEVVEMGLQLLEGHGIVLNRHVLRNEGLPIALLDMTAEPQIVRGNAPDHTVPVDAHPADTVTEDE